MVLESAGGDSLRVAEALRKLYVLSLREASELLAKTPAVLKPDVWHAEADLVKSKLEAAGAVVRLEPREE